MKFDYHYIQVNPKQIAFLKFIIEGYDGLAVVTTINKDEGMVRLSCPVSRKIELYSLVNELFPGKAVTS